MSYEEEQKWESDWWGKCLTTFGEETKQITYAHRMGLVIAPHPDWHWPVYDLEGKSVLDIGGGPVSILLKTMNPGRRTVVDPCSYPEWVHARYKEAGINYVSQTGEDFSFVGNKFDECWIYNCLQHVRDPELIIKNARSHADLIRIFEWIDIPPCAGHPHELKAELLDHWLGGRGTVEIPGENGCTALAYYGVFET